MWVRGWVGWGGGAYGDYNDIFILALNGVTAQNSSDVHELQDPDCRHLHVSYGVARMRRRMFWESPRVLGEVKRRGPSAVILECLD